MSARVRIGVLAALVSTVTALSATAAAQASATMTSPANGATVALDSRANFSFSWTLPPGEVGPQVYEGNTPTYDPETLAPFGGICGAPDVEQQTVTCRPDSPVSAGTHYAFIFTTNSDNTAHYYSPVTSFVVPFRIGWGCGPKLMGDCADPSGVKTTYAPHPPIGPPTSSLEVSGWLNAAAGTAVKFSFTLKHGRKVLATIHDVQHTDDFWVSSGFELLHTQIRFGHQHVHWRGEHGGTRLTSTFVMSGGGLTLTRTAKVRAPAARG